MKFKDTTCNTAKIECHDGIMAGGTRLIPYMGIQVVSVASFSIFLNLSPTSATELRGLADKAEKDWADWEAFKVYQENANPEPAMPGDCAEDARFLGQTPMPF